MHKELLFLLEKNKKWAKRMTDEDSAFFQRLSNRQEPQFLWIGCSDSRIPSSRILDSNPGEVFVHRNIANMVHYNDINVLSVLQYSVEVLKVRHIIVCGHYSCGGVLASLEASDHGLIDNWIQPVKLLYESHKKEFEGMKQGDIVDRLCEGNVRQQVVNVARTTILQKAWRRRQEIAIHGLIYSIKDGVLADLNCSISKADEMPEIFHVK